MLRGTSEIAQTFNLSERQVNRLLPCGRIPGAVTDRRGQWIIPNPLASLNTWVVPSPFFDYALPDRALGITLEAVPGSISGQVFVGERFKGPGGKVYQRLYSPMSGCAVKVAYLETSSRGDAGWKDLVFSAGND